MLSDFLIGFFYQKYMTALKEWIEIFRQKKLLLIEQFNIQKI